MPEVFVYHPDYSPVQAFANTRDITISSGTTVVEGIYYSWDNDGFTSNGWLYNIKGGPTNMYPDFKNDGDVANYVATEGSLDAVFNYWSTVYSKDGWNAFYSAVNYNCWDVVN